MEIFDKYYNVKFNWLIVIAMLFSASVLFNPILNKISLYAIIPLVFFYSLLSDKNLFKNKFILIYFIILLWTMLSYFAAKDTTLAIDNIITISGTFLLSVIFLTLSKNEKYLPWLYAVYIVILIINTAYMYINLADRIDISNARVGDENLNANRFGFILFYTIIAFYQFSTSFIGVKKKIYTILLLILIFSVPYFALITSSRQIVLIVIPFAIYTLFKRFGIFRLKFQALFYIFVLVVFFVLIKEFYFFDYSTSLLNDRLSSDFEGDVRIILMLEGLKLGISNPIFGVGPGNTVLYLPNGLFTHCSYTELFASSGFLPMFLYIVLIIKFIVDQRRYYKITRDSFFQYMMIVGIFWAAFNFFYVFYSATWIMAFLFLLIGHSQQKFRTYKIALAKSNHPRTNITIF